MSDIVVYTRPEVLEHKRGGDGFTLYYWSMKRPPKRFECFDRIFFAVGGVVVGSFESTHFDPHDPKETIVWHKKSWIPLSNPIPTKPFRGFRYVWWNQ